MRDLHFILGKAEKARPNGVNQVIAGLAKYLNIQKVNVIVLGLANSSNYEGEIIKRDGFSVEAYTKISKKSVSRLIDEIKASDCVHFHGLYNIFNIFAAWLCLAFKKSYVITTHDGLSPVRLNQRKTLAKKMFNFFLQKKFVERASAIHVLTEEEGTDLINFGYSGNIYVIPNGVDLDDYPVIKKKINRSESEELKVGYLGRLSPEKNIKNLIKSFSKGFKGASVKLFLAGPNSNYLKSVLKDKKGLTIEYVGPLYGEQKKDFIESLDLFVHPTFADVFSIAAMEVLAIGTPLIITRTSNSSYFYNTNAFYMCEPTAFGINRGIQHAIETRDSWEAKTKAGRDLIESKFNWIVASSSVKDMYLEICQQNSK